uniref:Dynein assembly factor with WD repeat domains 1 n=1 Tax=Mastacembelus armatus TaxID=205130 RepID=A0A7N8YEU6_9TELE
MKLKRFFLRYYPPGIILEFEKGGYLRTKSIDLLDLTPETNPDELVAEIRQSEPLITESRADQVKQLIFRLQQKQGQQDHHRFCFFKELKAHILPLTNVAFDKSGSRFITGSYDRTCRVWDTASGTELHTLEGHRNVVYAIAFNNPYGDKIATGSFDKTCKLWCAETGKCFHTFRGHIAEIVCLAFNPQSTLVATGSMDTTAKLWDVETGEEVATLTVNVIVYTTDCCFLFFLRRVHTLIGHRGEISNVQFNWDCSLIVTGSMDKTCKLWETVSGKCVATLVGHKEEVLDVCFDLSGQTIATASADGTARVFSATTHECLVTLEGHDGEISKICFSPQGNRVLTASSDKTARLWDVQSGVCLQVLEGHTDEIFSCVFNYEGDTIITGSKDNTCRIWY